MGPPRSTVVHEVEPEAVRPLRRAVLRPGRPASEVRFPGDDDRRAAHVLVREDDSTTTAVGSVLPEAPPWDPGRADAWRVRGMATDPDHRARGLGSLVLDALLAHVAASGGGLVWCSARVGARRFYERAGFVGGDDVFESPGIGQHTNMWRMVEHRAGPATAPGGRQRSGLGSEPGPVPT